MELNEQTLRHTNINIHAHSCQWWDDTKVSDAPFETTSRLLLIKFGRL